MNLLVVLGALAFLVVVAYRGYSVILFAPIAALGAVLLTSPALVAPVGSGLYMEKLVAFLKLYFPVFVLGAVFGKTIELAGFSRSIASWVVGLVGRERTILAIVLVSALLTYGGVSLFVVVFAVYPFAAHLFRHSDIPRRLIPGTIALGTFTFTMDCLPGTPQIQNIIPTAFFHTTIYAAPWLGTIGAALILALGLAWLEWRRSQAAARGEGYDAAAPAELAAEPTTRPPAELDESTVHPLWALLPLVVVGVANKGLALAIPWFYGPSHAFSPAAVGDAPAVVQDVTKVGAIWAVEGALVLGIATVFMLAFGKLKRQFAEGCKPAIAGALLASMNTASEYGFGAVIASLPGFRLLAQSLAAIPDPLVNEAVSITALAGITGSASGGLSVALAALSDTFIRSAEAADIPLDVLHRVAAMASGGMDTLPHNGAVITLLTVTGLTHRQAYGDIFVITIIKTLAVFAVIAVYRWTGLV